MQENEKVRLEDAQKLVADIAKLKIVFNKEADDKDQLMDQFKKEILGYLLDNNIKIKSDDLIIREPIKTLGEHEIEINPYVEVSKIFKIQVNKN